MVAASPVPTIIAGMAMRARREIAAHFFVQHATSADDAVAFVPDRPIVRRQFEAMQRKGVIRQAAPGYFWIDTAAYQTERDRQRRRLVPIVLLLVLIAAAIPLFFYKG